MSPSSYSVTLGLTAGLALLSAVLNSALLRALLRSRPRQRTSGMLALSCLEVALSLLLASAMLWHADAPLPLLDSAHALQMTRNHWLVAFGSIRLATLIRPRGTAAAAATAAAGRGRFGRPRQLALLASLGALSGVTLFAVAVGFEDRSISDDDSAATVVGPLTNISKSFEQLLENAFNLTEFQHRARSMLLKYSVFSAVGVLAPGIAVTGITVKTVHILQAGQLLHPATRRTTKAVALLCAAFAVCQFPLAAAYVATAAHLLSLRAASAQHVASVVELLESVSSWSLALVPADSCLTFLILARYSRHFRALLLGRCYCGCCFCCCDPPLNSGADENRDNGRHGRRPKRRHHGNNPNENADMMAMCQLTSANQVTAGITSSAEPEPENG